MPTDAAAAHAAAQPLRKPPGAGPNHAGQKHTGQKHTGLKIAGLAAGAIALAVAVIGLAARAHDSAQLKSWTAAQAIPDVSVISPTQAAGGQSLVLPGTLQAYYNAPIYARVPGYLKRWYTDIGAQVSAGQVLADIDTPELDQQLEQARADLASAVANQNLAALTAKRWTNLLAQDAVSRQESDEKNGDLAAKTALVAAAKANVDRLAALEAFKQIRAPFAGVVTARRTDIGDLINAGATASPNAELFDVAKVDPLRLYVRVPQDDSARIKPGMAVTLTVPEHPGVSFSARLTSTSGAVNDASGTLLAEMQVDNANSQLKPGDYTQVSFDLPPAAGGAQVLRVPASALLFRKEGMQVAVVGPGDRAVLKSVKIARDLGQSVEIASGVAPTDRIIDNPPDSLASGDLVRVVSGQAAAPGGPNAAG